MAVIDKKLRIFRMAATLMNFSETAEALEMTQPNVTQQIAALENEFGTPLFVRNGRRLVLTAAGAALKAECSLLFDTASELHRRVRNAADAVRRYRIGATMTAGGYVLPELFASYLEKHPQVRLSLRVENTDEVAEKLKYRQLDLGLVEGPFDAQFFLSEELLRDELVPVAAPGFLPPDFSLEEYIRGGGHFVLRESGSGTRYWFDRFLRQRNLPLPSDDNMMISNSFDAIKLLVRRGRTLTVISPLATADEVKHGELAISRFTEGKIVRSLNFIYTPGADLAFCEDFIRFCRGISSRSCGRENQENAGTEDANPEVPRH